MKKYNEILECVPLFRGISEEERQQMLDCLGAQQQACFWRGARR